MKICTFCGRENDNAAMQCRECCTEEFRYPTLDEITASAAPAEPTEPQSEWELFVELSLRDTKDLVQRFEEEGIEFKLINDEPSGSRSDPITASHGGNFGRGGLFRIFIRPSDSERVQKIWKRFCNFDN